jgi:hypothetical protein
MDRKTKASVNGRRGSGDRRRTDVPIARPDRRDGNDRRSGSDRRTEPRS